MDSPEGRAAPKSDKSDLEVFLRVTGPELLRKHAANIVLGVLLLAALTVFIVTRMRSKAAQQAVTNQNTAVAYDFASQARQLFAAPVLSDEAARARQGKVRDTLSAVDLVLSSDAQPSQKAAAQLAKAEVLWLLATAPEQAIATTQPVVGFTARPPESYLDDAEAAYTEILSKYANEKEYAANALLSLAAIAETRRNFDAAAEWYRKVIGDTSLRTAYHDIANARLKLLDEIRIPYILATPAATQPATATAPAATLPAATAPATQAAPMP